MQKSGDFPQPGFDVVALHDLGTNMRPAERLDGAEAV